MMGGGALGTVTISLQNKGTNPPTLHLFLFLLTRVSELVILSGARGTRAKRRICFLMCAKEPALGEAKDLL